MAFDKVNLAEKFARFTDYANPRIAGELNESYVKLVKLKGEFVWHHHGRAHRRGDFPRADEHRRRQ